jgi:hypothetical protein
VLQNDIKINIEKEDSQLKKLGFENEQLEEVIKYFKSPEKATKIMTNYYFIAKVNEIEKNNGDVKHAINILNKNEIKTRYNFLKHFGYDYTDQYKIGSVEYTINKLKNYLNNDITDLFDLENLDKRWHFKKNIRNETDVSKLTKYYIQYINNKLKKYNLKLEKNKAKNPSYFIKTIIKMPDKFLNQKTNFN